LEHSKRGHVDAPDIVDVHISEKGEAGGQIVVPEEGCTWICQRVQCVHFRARGWSTVKEGRWMHQRV
jgi:hypothetical protein